MRGIPPSSVDSPHKVIRKIDVFFVASSVKLLNNQMPVIWDTLTIISLMTHAHHGSISHYSDVKWLSWHLELPVNRVLIQQYVQTNNKETTQVRVTVPLWGGSTGDWNPPATGGDETVTQKMFLFDDVIIKFPLVFQMLWNLNCTFCASFDSFRYFYFDLRESKYDCEDTCNLNYGESNC